MFIYTVKQGDQLAQIAADFKVTPESIITANGLPNPANLLPGQSLIIPTAGPVAPKTPVSVNGYQYFLGAGEVHIVNENGPYLSILTPFSYTITGAGDLSSIDDVPLIGAAYGNRILPMMCIENFTSAQQGQNVAHALFSDQVAMQNLISNVLAVIRQKGYRGLNIDFEYIQPDDRESYNEFLRMITEQLHREGYFVSSAVAPKTGPQQTGLLYAGVDYPVHGSILDFVILMTYEWGYRMGPPQAISPLNLIRNVLDYAVSVIPRNKLFFGFQIYARDWLLPHVQGQEAETFSCQEAIVRAAAHNAPILYDNIAQSPFYRYRDDQNRPHEVWFEDARSAQAKFDTVREYGLAGISYWVLGYPFPQNWTLLEENFQINKFLST